MKRPERAPGGAPERPPLPPDESFRRDYPSLWDMLTTVRWEDGESRETSTLMLLIEGGVWKAQLRDRELQQALWRTGDSLDDVLIELEGAASQESCRDWRPMGGGYTPKRKK